LRDTIVGREVMGEKFSRFYEKLCRIKYEIKRLAKLKWDTKKLELMEEEGAAYTVKGFGEVNIGNVCTIPLVQPRARDFIKKGSSSSSGSF